MVPTNLPRALFLAGVLCVHGAMAQQSRGTLEIDADQRLAYSLGTAEPVVELTYVGGFIDSDDRIRTTVYVEGSTEAPRYFVETYRPPYMKEAGLYRSEISEEEFRRLMRSFGTDAVLDASSETFERAVDAELAASPTLGATDIGTHDARVQVDLRIASESVDAFEPNLRSLSVPSTSLQSVARSASDAPRDVASGVLALEGLIRSKKLERVE